MFAVSGEGGVSFEIIGWGRDVMDVTSGNDVIKNDFDFSRLGLHELVDAVKLKPNFGTVYKTFLQLPLSVCQIAFSLFQAFPRP